jgi:hypothetical protein
MEMHLLPAYRGMGKALWLAIASWPLCALLAAAPQSGKAHDSSRTYPERSHPERLPVKPTVPPSFSISLEPLGFSAPGPIYLGQRFSLVSLDFLDENRLLFTFRVPGLIHRQLPKSEDQVSEERHIKALVLSLPTGAVQAEAVWALHDRARYLWMLKDGRFLLRDKDELRVGDASLDLKPFLHFPGPLLSVEMDPMQQLLVTNSREPASVAAKPGEVPSPATAAAKVVSESDLPKADSFQPELVLRILRRETGKVMMVSRVRSAVHLPLNADGYLEMLPAKTPGWQLNLNTFGGAAAKLGEVSSTCTPMYDFISEKEILVSTCNKAEVRGMVAMDMTGRHLWEELPESSPVWPVVVVGADGSRLARESLAVGHPVNAYSPLSFDDVKGQVVEVFDAANGKIELAAAASPVLDAGGNVAISPSGRRVAILNAGAIQVFDLPAPPLLPEAPSQNQAAKSAP